MFSPASLKGDSPTPIDENIRNKIILLYWFIIFISFIPVSILEYCYIIILWRVPYYFLFLILLPINIFIIIHVLQISALIFASLVLKIINLIHFPKEGFFKRDINDRDYFFWNVRNIVKKWPLFITSSNPFPWFKNRFALRFFGVKIGKKNICDNSWISSEFVKIGENVIIGMNSTVLTFGIEQDNFIIKKIEIQNNALIGAKCVLLPGTVVLNDAKLAAHSYTNYDSILQEGKIYSGHPAKLIQEKQES
jgi:acetyltransferase-like isoleucine patch superfamily enzyme